MEREFYVRHYGGNLRFVEPDLDRVHAELFAPGKRYHLLHRVLPNTHKRLVVEVGCSDGRALVYLKRRLGFSGAIGFDIAIQESETVNGMEFKYANFNERLPLDNGSVDVFIAMMVIEHLFDPFQAFREINRVLAPDGVAVVNLPLVTSVKNRLRLMLGRVPETSVPFARWIDDEEWDGNHLHYFSLPSIYALALKTGFRLDAISACGNAHKLKEKFPSLLANEITFALRHKK